VFTEDVRFDGARFGADARFDEAAFYGDARFDDAVFDKAPTFTEAFAESRDDRSDVWPKGWRRRAGKIVREGPGTAATEQP
jgi:hypothetical protein